jgi:hypothetical protein
VHFTSCLHLQHESLCGGILAKGDFSSMVEDAPTTAEICRRRCVMGIVREVTLGEVIVSGIH